MTTKRTTRSLVGAACALTIVAAPVAADARRGDRDRDHDGLSDRWEHGHGLSTRSNSAFADPDRDGLVNRLERRFHLDPRDADTDDDGVLDGAEDRDRDGVANDHEAVATVASFTGDVLVITLRDGTTARGRVTTRTKLRCESAPTATAARDGGSNSGSSSGSDDDSGDDHGDDALGDVRGDGTPEDHGAGDDADDDHGDDADEDRGDDDGRDDRSAACTTAALTAGATVLEAELHATSAGQVFDKVEVQTAS